MLTMNLDNGNIIGKSKAYRTVQFIFSRGVASDFEGVRTRRMHLAPKALQTRGSRKCHFRQLPKDISISKSEGKCSSCLVYPYIEF